MSIIQTLLDLLDLTKNTIDMNRNYNPVWGRWLYLLHNCTHLLEDCPSKEPLWSQEQILPFLAASCATLKLEILSEMVPTQLEIVMWYTKWYYYGTPLPPSWLSHWQPHLLLWPTFLVSYQPVIFNANLVNNYLKLINQFLKFRNSKKKVKRQPSLRTGSMIRLFPNLI